MNLSIPETCQLHSSLRTSNRIFKGYIDTITDFFDKNPYEFQKPIMLPLMSRALRYYIHIRALGLDLEIAQGTYAFQVLFHGLWNWKFKLNVQEQEAVFSSMASTFSYVLQKRHVVARPEFAFLTGWAGTFNWALPIRDNLLSAKHGMTELVELANLPQREIIPAFFGMRTAETAWERSGEKPDGLWVCSQIGLFRSEWRDLDTYGKYIQPFEDKLSEEIKDFTQTKRFMHGTEKET